MVQVVFQPQLCPSMEIMLSRLTYEHKKTYLADAVIAVDFDIINPGFLLILCVCEQIHLDVHLFLPMQSSLKMLGGINSFFPFLSALLKVYSGLRLVTFKHSACLLEMCHRS